MVGRDHRTDDAARVGQDGGHVVLERFDPLGLDAEHATADVACGSCERMPKRTRRVGVSLERTKEIESERTRAIDWPVLPGLREVGVVIAVSVAEEAASKRGGR